MSAELLPLFFASLLIGLSIAAPVGPIGLLTIQRSLDHGPRAGLATGLGAAVADAVYGAVGAYGVTWLLDALIDQSALAIERVFLVEDMDRVKRNAETDRLRSALLTSISHDLKTPLAAVLGSASTLRDLSGKLDDVAKAELLATVIDESERLNRFIANLLDMTKLESGAIAPNVAPYDLREIVDTALRRVRVFSAPTRPRACVTASSHFSCVTACLNVVEALVHDSA